MNGLQVSQAFSLPWPHCWTQVQWQISAWVAQYGASAIVEVIWNESLLEEQVDAASFQAATADYCKTLQHLLGAGYLWRFTSSNRLIPHQLVLNAATKQRT